MCVGVWLSVSLISDQTNVFGPIEGSAFSSTNTYCIPPTWLIWLIYFSVYAYIQTVVLASNPTDQIRLVDMTRRPVVWLKATDCVSLCNLFIIFWGVNSGANFRLRNISSFQTSKAQWVTGRDTGKNLMFNRGIPLMGWCLMPCCLKYAWNPYITKTCSG